MTKDKISKNLNQYEANLLMSSESTSARMQKLGSDILNFNRYISGEEIIKKSKPIKKMTLPNQANKIFNSSISGLQRLVAEFDLMISITSLCCSNNTFWCFRRCI